MRKSHSREDARNPIRAPAPNDAPRAKRDLSSLRFEPSATQDKEREEYPSSIGDSFERTVIVHFLSRGRTWFDDISPARRRGPQSGHVDQLVDRYPCKVEAASSNLAVSIGAADEHVESPRSENAVISPCPLP